MFGDIGKMLKMVGEMKKRMPEMQARLAVAEYTAQAGGGTVKATVNGKMALVGLQIAPAAMSDALNDPGLLEDLVKAAVAAAQSQASEAAAAAMKELTGGMDLPPGMGF
jgi:DNA-binding YbaB/EbfC family protein